VRTENQRLWDLTAILFLFDCISDVSSIDGNLKIQKLGFISEVRGLENKLRTMHYKFFRYTYGPYSKDLANDVGFLKERGFLTSDNRLTSRGSYLLKLLVPEAEKNETAATSLHILNSVCSDYGKQSGIELKRKVYDMVVPVVDYSNCPLKVRDIGLFTDILDPNLTNDSQEIEAFSDDILNEVKEELAISAEELDPRNEAVRNAVLERLHNAL